MVTRSRVYHRDSLNIVRQGDLMRYRRWRRQSVVLLGVWMLYCKATLRESKAAATSILSLGILQENRRPHERLSASLIEELAKTEQILPASDLRVYERTCRMAPCLALLAATRGAKLIVWGDVRRNERREQTVDMRVYDAETRSSYHRTATGPEESLEAMVRALGPRILQEFRTPLAKLTLGELTNATSNLTVNFYDPIPKRRPSWRVGIASALAVVGIVSLGGSIALTALNHSTAPDDRCAAQKCVWDFTGLFSVGYTLVVLSGVGVGLSIGLPW